VFEFFQFLYDPLVNSPIIFHLKKSSLTIFSLEILLSLLKEDITTVMMTVKKEVKRDMVSF